LSVTVDEGQILEQVTKKLWRKKTLFRKKNVMGKKAKRGKNV
jgi:hypothetical protein